MRRPGPIGRACQAREGPSPLRAAALRWLTLLATCLACCLAPRVLAQGLESVLSPGPLARAHAKLEGECSKCHVRFDRSAQARLCMDCHKDVGRDMRERTGMHGRLKPQPCRSCHTDHRGIEAGIAEFDRKAFDHRATDHALRGRHETVECAACHVAGRKYRDAPSECQSCHRKDDRHEGTLGADCASCHGDVDWKASRFEHSRTKFALSGKHGVPPLKCADCHRDHRSYRGVAAECVACHRKDDMHEGTLGSDCASCHADSSWKASRFDHGGTKFALSLGHAVPPLKCTDCHRDHRSYRRTALDCASCHRKDDKHEGQLGARCDSCHSPAGWRVAAFDHARARFALVGGHTKVSCDGCHKSLRHRDAPRECVGCHQKDDKHKARFGTACESCHNARDWRLWTFDHARRAGYALESGHARVACESCHRQPAPAGKTAAPVERACASCHGVDDAHDGAFGARCEQCHGADNWKHVNRRLRPSSDRGAGAPSRLTPPRGGKS